MPYKILAVESGCLFFDKVYLRHCGSIDGDVLDGLTAPLEKIFRTQNGHWPPSITTPTADHILNGVQQNRGITEYVIVSNGSSARTLGLSVEKIGACQRSVMIHKVNPAVSNESIKRTLDNLTGSARYAIKLTRRGWYMSMETVRLLSCDKNFLAHAKGRSPFHKPVTYVSLHCCPPNYSSEATAEMQVLLNGSRLGINWSDMMKATFKAYFVEIASVSAERFFKDAEEDPTLTVYKIPLIIPLNVIHYFTQDEDLLLQAYTILNNAIVEWAESVPKGRGECAGIVVFGRDDSRVGQDIPGVEFSRTDPVFYAEGAKRLGVQVMVPVLSFKTSLVSESAPRPTDLGYDELLEWKTSLGLSLFVMSPELNPYLNGIIHNYDAQIIELWDKLYVGETFNQLVNHILRFMQADGIPISTVLSILNAPPTDRDRSTSLRRLREAGVIDFFQDFQAFCKKINKVIYESSLDPEDINWILECIATGMRDGDYEFVVPYFHQPERPANMHDLRRGLQQVVMERLSLPVKEALDHILIYCCTQNNLTVSEICDLFKLLMPHPLEQKKLLVINDIFEKMLDTELEANRGSKELSSKLIVSIQEWQAESPSHQPRSDERIIKYLRIIRWLRLAPKSIGPAEG